MGGFVVFPIKTAEGHTKRPAGPPLDWYKIRHVPSWFKLGPEVRLQVSIQEDDLWPEEMLQKQHQTKKQNNEIKNKTTDTDERKNLVGGIDLVVEAVEEEACDNENNSTEIATENINQQQQQEEINIELSDDYSMDSFDNSENETTNLNETNEQIEINT